MVLCGREVNADGEDLGARLVLVGAKFFSSPSVLPGTMVKFGERLPTLMVAAWKDKYIDYAPGGALRPGDRRA